MERNYSALTIQHAQTEQPWTLPYNPTVMEASTLPGQEHVLATHAVLHAQKSLGKIAAVLEGLDHTMEPIDEERIGTIRDMAADLMTAALRLANLYEFDMAEELVRRVEEKNGIKYPAWDGQ